MFKKIKMGDIVQDKISGFKGKVTGFCQYITGCQSVLVNPGVDKDGKWVESHWIDEPRLEKSKEKKVEVKLKNAKTGGDILPDVK